MAIEVTPKAIEVLKRALEAGRMDPALVGVRLSVDRGGTLRTGFTEEPESGDATLDVGGVRLYVPPDVDGDRVLDVTGEHDQLMLRPRD